MVYLIYVKLFRLVGYCVTGIFGRAFLHVVLVFLNRSLMLYFDVIKQIPNVGLS